MKTILFLVSLIFFAQYACYNKQRLGHNQQRLNHNQTNFRTNLTSIIFLQLNSTTSDKNNQTVITNLNPNSNKNPNNKKLKLIPGKTYIRIKRFKNSTVIREKFTVPFKNPISSSIIRQNNSSRVNPHIIYQHTPVNSTILRRTNDTQMNNFHKENSNFLAPQQESNSTTKNASRTDVSSASTNSEFNNEETDELEENASSDEEIEEVVEQSPFHRIFIQKSSSNDVENSPENCFDEDLDVDDFALFDDEEDNQEDHDEDDDDSDKQKVDVESH
jgi:hypothetical protein